MNLHIKEKRKEEIILRKLFITVILILAILFSSTTVFAATNSNITIVNPVTNSISYSTNLLISVKITKPTTIKVDAKKQMKTVNGTLAAITYDDFEKAKKDKEEGKEPQKFTGVSIITPENFVTSNDLSFYTKKLENVVPGVYLIKIETLDAENKVTHTNSSYVIVKDKSELEEEGKKEAVQPGAAQFIQNLLKSIFGN